MFLKKLNKKSMVILSICAILCCLIGVGVYFLLPTNNKNGEILSAKQQEAYSAVELYAQDCLNAESVLQEIKIDISNATTDEALNLEKEIGFLKIDKIKTQENAETEIQNKRNKATSDKSNYNLQMKFITNKYQGNETSYNSDVAYYQSLISQEYASYLSYRSSVQSNPNLRTGFKEQLISQAKNEYENAIIPYQTQLEILETQWENKLEYDRYSDLIDKVDKNLEKDIKNIESNCKQKLDELDNEILILISKREF